MTFKNHKIVQVTCSIASFGTLGTEGTQTPGEHEDNNPSFWPFPT